jgi:hypothetical protein
MPGAGRSNPPPVRLPDFPPRLNVAGVKAANLTGNDSNL